VSEIVSPIKNVSGLDTMSFTETSVEISKKC